MWTLEQEAVQSKYVIPPTDDMDRRARITEGHALFSEVVAVKGHCNEPNVEIVQLPPLV